MNIENLPPEDDVEIVASEDSEEELQEEQPSKVEIPDDDEEFIIKYEDDTPVVEPIEGDPTDEDLERYGRKTKQRIHKLLTQRDKERQSRSAAEQREKSAIEFARALMSEKESLQKELERQRSNIAEQSKSRLESQLDVVRNKYRAAYEEGDADGMADAQATMARLQAEAFQMERDQAQLNALREQAAARQQYQQYQQYQQPQYQQPQYQQPQYQQPQYQQPQYQQPQQPVNQPSQMYLNWAEKNKSWWNVDKPMTSLAVGYHEQLIAEGIDPDTKEYYDAIDSGIRKAFPDRFSATDKRKSRASVVAPAARSGRKIRHVVPLVESERALAKTLGLTEEYYAEHKHKYLKEKGE